MTGAAFTAFFAGLCAPYAGADRLGRPHAHPYLFVAAGVALLAAGALTLPTPGDAR